jgi:cell division septum initiation protein DivIVA
MEDILNRAMAELDSRSEVIVKERDIEEANIVDLKEQIKALEAKVAIANDKVSSLNEEQSMISKNSKAIERMKASNITPKTIQKNK